MKRRTGLLLVAAVIATAIAVGVQAAGSNSAETLTAAQIALFTTRDADLVATAAADPTADPPPGHLSVQPHEFDPGKTSLVQADWSGAEGCPNNVSYPVYPDTQPSGATYTDPACATASDPKDHENDGLVLDKMGPTANNATAFAEIKGVKDSTLTELGYDVRKFGTRASANGSHCGAGAPRFDVSTTAGLFFVGCQSPPPDSETDGQAWIRLRWGTPAGVVGYSATTGLPTTITGAVQHIYLVFDEGTDTGPDFFGAAVLDNVDVNGLIGGTGPDDPEP